MEHLVVDANAFIRNVNVFVSILEVQIIDLIFSVLALIVNEKSILSSLVFVENMVNVRTLIVRNNILLYLKKSIFLRFD